MSLPPLVTSVAVATPTATPPTSSNTYHTRTPRSSTSDCPNSSSAELLSPIEDEELERGVRFRSQDEERADHTNGFLPHVNGGVDFDPETGGRRILGANRDAPFTQICLLIICLLSLESKRKSFDENESKQILVFVLHLQIDRSLLQTFRPISSHEDEILGQPPTITHSPPQNPQTPEAHRA